MERIRMATPAWLRWPLDECAQKAVHSFSAEVMRLAVAGVSHVSCNITMSSCNCFHNAAAAAALIGAAMLRMLCDPILRPNPIKLVVTVLTWVSWRALQRRSPDAWMPSRGCYMLGMMGSPYLLAVLTWTRFGLGAWAGGLSYYAA